MNLNLNGAGLKKLTKHDLISFCKLINADPKDIKSINLSWNNLTDLNFITLKTPFKNIEVLNLNNNDIKDITRVKYLKRNLKELDVSANTELKNINSVKYLKKLEILKINYFLKIKKSESIETIKKLLNLKKLFCSSTFNTDVLNLKKDLPNVEII